MKLLAAFAAIYFLWGSNFLAIRYAAEAMPPFLMMGVRCLIAGSILYAWARFKEGARVQPGQWRPAWSVGTLLFLGCHGLLAWAEQTVPSGIAALVLATIPVWLTILDWASGGVRPAWQAMLGLVLGFAGLAVLVTARSPAAGGLALPLAGTLVLMLSAFCWAAGSILSRRVSVPENLVLSSGMQLLAGGVSLVAFGMAIGEPESLHAASFALRGILGFAYMIVFSSLIGFTAYMWLLRVSTPTLVGTYAFVNPVVALFVGWAFAAEPLTARTLLATFIIVAGVAIIVSTRKPAVKETKA